METRSTSPKLQDLVIERTFNATPDKVWNALTDPRIAMIWMSPENFTCPVYKIDLRVGGKFLTCMRSPEGQEIWGAGEYREIIPNQRLVYTDSFADAKGNIVPASYYGMAAEYPLSMLVKVTLERLGDRTKLTLTYSGLPQGQELDNARIGWNQSFDKLARTLESSKQGEKAMTNLSFLVEPCTQEVVVEYSLEAPEDLVFRTFTDPKLYSQWWGERDSTTKIERMDVKPGGSYRIIQHDKKGTEYAFHGIYHSIENPHHLVQTMEYEGQPGHVSLETITLERMDGHTHVREVTIFESVADRDQMVQWDMERGARESADRQNELISRLKSSSR